MSALTPEAKSNIDYLSFEDGSELWLIGTAHVSKTSAELVAAALAEIAPDSILVELDTDRLAALQSEKTVSADAVLSAYKSGRTMQAFFGLLLTGYQERTARRLNSRPGEEFRRAAAYAAEHNIPLIPVDRNITITLRRMFQKTPKKEKLKLLLGLFSPAEKDSQRIEDLLSREDALTALMEKFGREMPSLTKVLLDERNRYMAIEIEAERGMRSVAIMGAAHREGVKELLQSPEALPEEQPDLDDEHETVLPVLARKWKLLAAASIAMLALLTIIFPLASFYAAITYLIVGSATTAILAILAKAHSVPVICTMLTAPFAPFFHLLRTGSFFGRLQLGLVPMRREDRDGISEDILTVKGWRSNHILRSLLTAIACGPGAWLGAGIGSLAATIAFVVLLIAG